MNLDDAAHLARTLMDDHGLQDIPFAFDRATVRAGNCHLRAEGYGRFRDFTVTRLTLSRAITERSTEAEVREVILHEVAHALTPGDFHGPKWKAVAADLGVRPSRYLPEEWAS